VIFTCELAPGASVGKLQDIDCDEALVHIQGGVTGFGFGSRWPTLNVVVSVKVIGPAFAPPLFFTVTV
jgi:hypothetical protein